jgi:hypothetical protein
MDEIGDAEGGVSEAEDDFLYSESSLRMFAISLQSGDCD